MDTKWTPRSKAEKLLLSFRIRTARGAFVVSIWCPVCKAPARFERILETIETPAIPLHIRGLHGKS